jgi:hypothetical protein
VATIGTKNRSPSKKYRVSFFMIHPFDSERFDLRFAADIVMVCFIRGNSRGCSGVTDNREQTMRADGL